MGWQENQAMKAQAKAMKTNIDKNHIRLISNLKPWRSKAKVHHKANDKLSTVIQLQCRLHDEAGVDATIRTRFDEMIADMAPTRHYHKYGEQMQWILDKTISIETLRDCIKTNKVPTGWSSTRSGRKRRMEVSNTMLSQQPAGGPVQVQSGQPKLNASHLPNPLPTPSTAASKRKRSQVDDDEDDEEVPARRIKVASQEPQTQTEQQTAEMKHTPSNNKTVPVESVGLAPTIKVEQKATEVVDISEDDDRANLHPEGIINSRPRSAALAHPEASVEQHHWLRKQRLAEIEIEDRIDKRALEKARLLRDQKLSEWQTQSER